MNWFYFALLAALCESLKDLCSKQGLRMMSPPLIALAASAVPIPLLLSYLLLTDSIPSLGPQFLPALMIGGLLNIAAFILFMRALQASDMSLAIPFVSFTPIFLLVTSPILVGDVPNMPNMVGILCIVIGAYVLQIPSTHQGWLTPLSSMFSQPGPRRMLWVALIYSITSNFDKIGVQHSSPILWSLSLTSVMTIGFALMLRFSPLQTIHLPSPNILGILFAIGLLQTMVLVFHNMALNVGPVPSVIAVKRSSILFATLWGLFLLREHHVRERLGAAILMLMGIVLISWD